MIQEVDADKIGESIDKIRKRVTVDEIISFEDGDLDEDQVIDLFQRLVDSGQVWHLQGFYGRTAMALIERGLVVQK